MTGEYVSLNSISLLEIVKWSHNNIITSLLVFFHLSIQLMQTSESNLHSNGIELFLLG